MKKFKYKPKLHVATSRDYCGFTGGPFNSHRTRLTTKSTLTFRCMGYDGEIHTGHYSGGCWVPLIKK